ncbi:MAG: hypothetical protein C0469_01650 [Cyanobacteria bacterium DS2.3.42]|nr:hypothetical protein [Cyanobacteria bacterium DS2.3.42]
MIKESLCFHASLSRGFHESLKMNVLVQRKRNTKTSAGTAAISRSRVLERRKRTFTSEAHSDIIFGVGTQGPCQCTLTLGD